MDGFSWLVFFFFFFTHTWCCVCVSFFHTRLYFYMFPALYLQSCCSSVLAKHSLKRQNMVWQKLSRSDFGETNRQLDSGTLSGSSVKRSQMSWIASGSSCCNTWTHMKTCTEEGKVNANLINDLQVEKSTNSPKSTISQFFPTFPSSISTNTCFLFTIWPSFMAEHVTPAAALTLLICSHLNEMRCEVTNHWHIVC